jgi:hypothetical protein
MLADMGTKPQNAIMLRRFKYWGLGARFLPPSGHIHFVLLQMQYYEQTFVIIQQSWSSPSS